MGGLLLRPVMGAEPRKRYSLEVLVQDEIVIVGKVANQDDPAEDLIAGLKEIAEKYRIKKTEAITQYQKYGSATEALIVYVEPKK